MLSTIQFLQVVRYTRFFKTKYAKEVYDDFWGQRPPGIFVHKCPEIWQEFHIRHFTFSQSLLEEEHIPVDESGKVLEEKTGRGRRSALFGKISYYNRLSN